ncbi:enoyl-CoA hydratase-related protein [Actinomadura madurae]|uniref:enoyl-CoA hydratase-related protein n=1 Tax=Actinomadura madurae TaxID=1993 RepID=UPI0020D2613D|nr:enoyl-CoA hydratase-related protein [Actinomadura madurae]
MSEYTFISYETLDEGTIARITLNRPEARNAQNRGMLVELNDAFLAAEADDTVRVVILRGAGKMFTARATTWVRPCRSPSVSPARTSTRRTR